jgi:prolyl-tRNA synthetase
MKQSQEGLTVKKEEDFSKWFTELMLKSELADYTEVSGCIAFRPRSWRIWEILRDEVDKRLRKIGIQNVYFPLFIPEKLLTKEAEHVEGFAPEVAWVTHAGSTKLNERLAIRPTSEAIMYANFSKWVRSYRDLPQRYNQWSNVVRWEFNNPIPFFRTREFLFNEGHTMFATEKEALKERDQIRKMYEEVCEEFLALPGIYGRKTEKEKFAGAVFTEKIHYAIPGGKIIEGPAFHYDGQNFAKAYEIKFQNKEEKEEYVYQNTWAISTRMLGAMFGIHSDNSGLIIPPKVLDKKIVIIPLLFKGKEKPVLEKAKEIEKLLLKFGTILDDREEYTPGFKYAEHELKGVPIRIELGPRDLENKSVMIKTRIGKEKISIPIKDLKLKIPELLDQIQQTLFDNAKKLLESMESKTENKEEMINLVNKKKMVKVPLKNSKEVEEKLKLICTGTKTLFIDPKNESVKNKKCIISGENADYWVYVGRTY